MNRAARCLILASLTFAQAGEGQEPATYDDPVYKQKGQSEADRSSRGRPFFDALENVDAFTGNLSLVHTDVTLPGNGGLDLKIQRSYNSRIWGRRDVSNPGLVALNERSVVGLGWSLHFGRARNPRGDGSGNRFLPNNPVVEMPDGTLHTFYRDAADVSRFVSRDMLRYRALSGTPLRYELLLTDGTKYIFTQAASYLTSDGEEIYQVESITSPSNNIVTFTYSTTDARLLQSLTETTGRTITFSYGTLTGGACGYDALQSINVNGDLYRYEYSLTNCVLQLIRVRPPVGPIWTYTYHSSNPGLHQLASVSYPTGATINYTFADVSFDVGAVNIPFSVVTRRVVGGRDLTAGTWNYSYAAATAGDQVTTITSPCGVERHTFSSFGSLPNSGAVSMWRLGLPLRRELVSAGATVRNEQYTWASSAAISNDDAGSGAWNGTTGFLFEAQIYRPQLVSLSVTQDGTTFTTSYANYDGYGNPGTITEAGNITRSTTLAYLTDPSRNIIRDHPTSRTSTIGGNSFTESYAYDANGSVTAYTRFGVATTYTYLAGNLASERDANGNTISYTYSRAVVSQMTQPLATIKRSINWNSTVAVETDGTGASTSFTYDPLGRVRTIVPPVGATSSITYDNASGATRVVARGGATTTDQYDGFGRSIGALLPEGRATSRTYDACGRVTFESYLYSGMPVGDTRVYDDMGRITRETHPDATFISYSYTSDGVATTDETGSTITRRYETFGRPDDRRLTSVIDGTGTTTITYNGNSSVIRITQPGSVLHSYTRDSRDYVTNETHPGLGTVTYTRDNVGDVTTRTDTRGSRSLQYDAQHRLTRVTHADGAIDIAYDQADRRTEITTSTSKLTYQYDGGGQLTTQNLTTGGTTFQTSYTYDPRGNATSIRYPSGRTLALTYDQADRVTGISGFVNNVAYHPSGKPTSIALANGRTVSRAINNRNLTTSINVSGILGLSYTYNGSGDVTQINDGVLSGRNQTLSYDAIHRMTSASGLWGSMTFQYDALGNRTRRSVGSAVTNYTYDSNGRLTSTTGADVASFVYDGTGNVTNLTGTGLTYDALGRMVGFGTAASYDYDGDGKRLKRTVAATGQVIVFHYDKWGRLISETQPNGTLNSDYVYLNNELIARIDNPGIIAVTAPANNATVFGSSVSIQATAMSPDGVAGVTFKVDGAPIGAEDTSNPYSINWNTTSLGNGSHTILAEGRTTSGSTISASITVIINHGTVALTAPANNASVSGGAVALQATATSPYGIGGLTFQVDGTALSPEVTSAPYSTTWNTTSGSNGVHQVSAVARTMAGVMLTSSVSAIVTNGSIAITAPSSGTTVFGAAVTLQATASSPDGIAGVTFSLDGLTMGAEDVTTPYQITWNTASAPNGTHQLSAIARTMTPSVTLTSAVVDVVVDNGSVAITAPAAGATVFGTAVALQATATSPDGIGGVTFKLDGTPIGSEITTAPYSTSWNTTAASPGAHQMSAVARTTSGIQLLSAVNVFVDNGSVTIVSPLSGTQIAGSAVALQATATSPDGIAGVTFRVDGGVTGTEDVIAPYATTWNSTAVGNGAHQISATARTTSGLSFTSNISVFVANGSVMVTAPTTGTTVSGSSVTLQASASSPDGIAGVTFSLDGTALPPEITAGPFVRSWNTMGVPNGSHQIRAAARTNTAGVLLNSLPITVTVANGSVTVTAPANNATVSGIAVTLAATATSPSGIAGVTFRIDGATTGTEDISSPFQITWNSTSVPAGTHLVSAVARTNTAGIMFTSPPVTIVVVAPVCHVRVFLKTVDYRGDDVGNDWTYSVTVNSTHTGILTDGTHNHFTVRTFNQLVHDATIAAANCASGVSRTLRADAKELDLFDDDEGSGSGSVTGVCHPGETRTFDQLVRVEVNEAVRFWPDHHAVLFFKFRLEAACT